MLGRKGSFLSSPRAEPACVSHCEPDSHAQWRPACHSPSLRVHASRRAAGVHNAGRLVWGSGPRGERPDYTGLDLIIVRDDKIAALYVFLDSMPP